MKHTENIQIYISHDLIVVQQRQISHYSGEGKNARGGRKHSDVANKRLISEYWLYQWVDFVWEEPGLEHQDDFVWKCKALVVGDRCLALP